MRGCAILSEDALFKLNPFLSQVDASTFSTWIIIYIKDYFFAVEKVVLCSELWGRQDFQIVHVLVFLKNFEMVTMNLKNEQWWYSQTYHYEKTCLWEKVIGTIFLSHYSICCKTIYMTLRPWFCFLLFWAFFLFPIN